MDTGAKITFDNTEVAFADKSRKDLKRMHFLFTTMNHPLIAKLGIWSTVFALKIKLPVKGLIRKTIFAQFCGGESLEDSRASIAKLEASNIKAILDYSAEGEKSEKGFDINKEEILNSLELAHGSSNVPIGVMKLTAFAPFELLEKAQGDQPLSDAEIKQFDRFKSRVDEICQRAVEYKKYMYIDAEETWIQDTIDSVAYEMMEKYNKEQVYIFNTYQMYRRDALDNLKNTLSEGKKNGFKVGAKLVRGAYMEKERLRAERLGYPDPIQPDKETCDRDFNKALEFCIEYISNMAVCAGSHNEYSNAYLTELMAAHQIVKDDPRVYFAQLYGMSDNISYMLSSQGYNVAKYLPYGPVEKVMPYLMRRAQENTSISGQSSREYLLVKKELSRRNGRA